MSHTPCIPCQQNNLPPCVDTNCYEPIPCECPIIDLKTSCLVADIEPVPCLPIAKGLNFNEWLKQLLLAICAKIITLQNNISNLTTLLNVGTGAKVYKGLNLLNQKLLRSIKKTGNLLVVTENIDDIDITIDEVVLTTFIQSLVVNPINYNAINVGIGAEVFKNETGTNPSTFNFRKIKKTTLGTGVEILKSIAVSGDDVEIQTKSISSPLGTLVITDDALTGNILVDLPLDVNNVTFYVNENSVAVGESGTQAKPFKTLNSALLAFRGTGTIINPQYGGVGKIQLLSNINTPSNILDINYIGYLSINNLNIDGGGFSINYNGAQVYPISTDYLIGLSGVNGAGQLNNPIQMIFSNLTVNSYTQHEIIFARNFNSGIVTPQNGSVIFLNNIKVNDFAYNTELVNYVNTSVTLFGSPVFAQNTLPTNRYNIKVQGLSWNGTSPLTALSVEVLGSSSTIFYLEDSSTKLENVSFNFSSYYRNYSTLASSVYSTRSGLNTIHIKNSSFVKIINLTQLFQVPASGGSFLGGIDNYIKCEGNVNLNVDIGIITSEKANSLISLDALLTQIVSLNKFDSSSLEISNSSSSFTVFGGTPLVQKSINVNSSIVNKVVYNSASISTVKPIAISAQINGNPYTTSLGFGSNALAIAGGLIQGNTYFNTSTNVNTIVI